MTTVGSPGAQRRNFMPETLSGSLFGSYQATPYAFTMTVRMHIR